MGMIIRNFTAIVLCFLTISLSAQKDATIQEIDGKRFYIHKVEAGNTLYGISKLYNTSVDDILKSNPEAEKGLKPGQSIRIPVPEDAKEDKWSNPIRMDGAFLIHKVMRGETLFGISRQYLVDVNTILELNPAANSGLSKGQELRIPVNKDEPDDLSDIKPQESDTSRKHTVKPGETLYSISKEYQVSIDELNKANNHFPEGLKAGAQIRIPRADDTYLARTKPVEYPAVTLIEAAKKDHYTIGMMLPFNLAVKDTSKTPSRENKLRNIALSLYRGALLAADSLEKTGFNAELIVTDVSAASTATALVNGGKLKDAQLIIGPLQRTTLEELSKQVDPQRAHIVCPVPQPNKVLLAHPNMSKILPSEISAIATMAKHIRKKYSNANIILINTGFTDDLKAVQAYLDEFSSAPAVAYTEHKTVGKSAGGLSGKLSTTKKNIIIAPTTNEVLLADLVTKLAQISETKYDISLFGMESWKDFKFLDAEQRNSFNLHLPSSTFADYSSKSVKAWILKYREQFATEPDEYAMIGYDVLMYYSIGLRDFGPSFAAHFDEIIYQPISLKVDLNKTGLESGFENAASFILKYEDYTLQNAER
jgi:LysM repeat protein